MENKVWVIGIEGDRVSHLSSDVKSRILDADLLMGGERHLEWFPEYRGERIAIESNLKEITEKTVAALKDRKQVVILASGDPLFYGIGAFLIKRIGKEKVEVFPAVSAMQLAFARVKESWQEAALVSLHAKPIQNVLPFLEEKNLIGIFTDDTNTPPVIARFLLEQGYSDWIAWVCENLGGQEEKVSELSLEKMVESQFSLLNVVILKRQEKKTEESAAVRPVTWLGLFGIPDDLFVYRKPKSGLITKKEIRVISLAELNLNAKSVVWDIGAGSGSVSIEAGRLCPEGKVFAIEKNKEDFDLIQTNMDRFGVKNLMAVCKRAPDGLNQFDDPDAVFIGGSGGELEEILSLCLKRLRPRGRIVANLITLDNTVQFFQFFKKTPLEVSYTVAQVSRSKPILEMTRYEALNPITIAVVKKMG
ncbi:MAG: precorrin-6y C5,15-methyltransferase (decarboxylating) subunit CbiE [Nitrospirae bacterium]|nr:precorrin-6y C5,15-methyltransferase (decarboxylating) subunit CbiE [Nitrospirota bacterium]